MLNSAVSGLIQGGTYALLGVCLVVMYRMVRVLNFAQTAIGAFGAYIAIVLSGHGWAYLPAAAVGAAAGAGVSVVCGGLMSAWFADAATERRSTVAIALMITVLTIGFRAFGHDPRVAPELFSGSDVTIFGVIVTWAGIAVVVAAIVLAVGVDVFLRRSRLGIRLRAQSERPQTAELLGVPARWLAVGVWAVTGAIAAFGILVVTPSRGADFLSLGLLVLPALAAASLGLFRSTWWAVAGGIAIGVVTGLVQQWPEIKKYQDVLPLLIILVVLMWTQRKEVWDAAR
jgi:branched-chain amino acid transport system permease protein